MRLRILSEFEQTTNLPQIRSWFNVDRENTVASLKLSLCASVPALCDARIRAAELVLTLDDFELLDDSAVNILRDGDLVWYVQQHLSYYSGDLCKSLRRRTHPAKRRAEITEDAPRKRHQSMPSANIAAVNRGPIEDCIRNDRIYLATRRRGRNKSTESSSSSSGSSSDTSSDDTSSDSDSTSGSSSDSGSDSTSSPPSGDLPPRIHRPLPPSAPQRKPPQPMYVTLSLLENSPDLGSSFTPGLSQYRPDLGSHRPTREMSVVVGSVSWSVRKMFRHQRRQAVQMQYPLALLTLWARPNR